MTRIRKKIFCKKNKINEAKFEKYLETKRCENNS